MFRECHLLQAVPAGSAKCHEQGGGLYSRLQKPLGASLKAAVGSAVGRMSRSLSRLHIGHKTSVRSSSASDASPLSASDDEDDYDDEDGVSFSGSAHLLRLGKVI